MLPNRTMKMENVWKTTQEPGYATNIPISLILLMALEDGWEAVKVEPVPSRGQIGSIYSITLKSHSSGQSQNLIMPKSALVEKLLDERGPKIISV
jgi:hypothetical protein